MLNFESPNQNLINSASSDPLNINYRERPPQTANNQYRPNNPINQHQNINNFNTENERNNNLGNINLPKVIKSSMKKNLNMSSDNIEHEDIDSNDAMHPKV